MIAGGRPALGAVLLVAVVLLAGCLPSRPGPDVESHPLPGLGAVTLPTGFAAYDREPAPHAGSGFFEFGGRDNVFGNHSCRAQITVARYDRELATPRAFVDGLTLAMCHSAFSATAYNEGWRQPDPADPGLWTVDFAYNKVGFVGESPVSAVGVLRFDAARGAIVGLWANVDVYSSTEAVAVTRGVAASVG